MSFFLNFFFRFFFCVSFLLSFCCYPYSCFVYMVLYTNWYVKVTLSLSIAHYFQWVSKENIQHNFKNSVYKLHRHIEVIRSHLTMTLRIPEREYTIEWMNFITFDDGVMMLLLLLLFVIFFFVSLLSTFW